MRITKQQLRQIIKEELEICLEGEESWMRGWGVTENLPTTLPEMVETLDEASGGVARFMGLAPGEGKDDPGTLVRAHKLINRVAAALRIHPAHEEELS